MSLLKSRRCHVRENSLENTGHGDYVSHGTNKCKDGEAGTFDLCNKQRVGDPVSAISVFHREKLIHDGPGMKTPIHGISEQRLATEKEIQLTVSGRKIMAGVYRILSCWFP